MGKPIRSKKGKLAGRGKHDARQSRAVQVKNKGRRKSAHLSSSEKKLFSNYDETKSKEEKEKKNGSKKSAHP